MKWTERDRQTSRYKTQTWRQNREREKKKQSDRDRQSKNERDINGQKIDRQ